MCMTPIMLFKSLRAKLLSSISGRPIDILTWSVFDCDFDKGGRRRPSFSPTKLFAINHLVSLFLNRGSAISYVA